MHTNIYLAVGLQCTTLYQGRTFDSFILLLTSLWQNMESVTTTTHLGLRVQRLVEAMREAVTVVLLSLQEWWLCRAAANLQTEYRKASFL